MYEPYLNREKQYLKVNAELDNRFKEIDEIKNESSDPVKPRLNVFGNSPKVHNPSTAKSAYHIPKQKRIESKCGTTKSSNESKDQSVLCETANLARVRIADKPQKLRTGAASARLNQTENTAHSIHKLLDNKDNDTNQASAAINPSSDIILKKNISSDGLIK